MLVNVYCSPDSHICKNKNGLWECEGYIKINYENDPSGSHVVHRDVCEQCHASIYNYSALLDPDRRDGATFCNKECIYFSKLKFLHCESCGIKIREDKLINERCGTCHKHWLEWKNYSNK